MRLLCCDALLVVVFLFFFFWYYSRSSVFNAPPRSAFSIRSLDDGGRDGDHKGDGDRRIQHVNYLSIGWCTVAMYSTYLPT